MSLTGNICYSGNGDVWHGYADILVKRCAVKIGTEVNEEDESYEPSPKKMRTENFEDEDSDDDSLNVKIQKDAFTCKSLSQLLSQTIVNAFAEVNKNQELSSSYIPSFFADSKTIRIIMYNCGSDSLVLTDSLDMFIHDRGKTILDVTTILSVWYALNFENNIDESDELFPKFKMLYQKSNFKDQTGERFETYSKKCTKPMTEAGENKDIQLFISVETLTTSSTFVLHVIEKSHSLLSHANS
ncbi:uncharacterized protein LOC132716107 [Ruditapes philippinarum]|uniref:uncharacterized protein LOC132716107 n=1 Tax=Ruditapes philippinarum TaxID=129788 RepID=UPI00295AB471|nr:uncharacterized protein LOC132716107 [Ruditapes philippinarum]